MTWNDIFTKKHTPPAWLKALGGGSGAWLGLKKCLCEVRCYRPPYTARRTKHGAEKYQIPISVIICTRNREEQLLSAVTSIKNQTLDSSLYEIIVVNNGDRLSSRTAEELKDVKIITEGRLGLSYARNTGAGFAAGKYLVYIDDDAEARPNMLEVTLDAFEKHKNVGIVGGQIILSPPGEPSEDVFLSEYESVWSGFRVPYKRFKYVSRQYEFPFGANFSVRHSALDVCGGFDVRYGRCGGDFAGGEETALCFDFLRHGFKIGIEPRSIVYHNVDGDRFTREHIRRTIRAGILTTYRLYADGYGASAYDEHYARGRVRIAENEISRLKMRGKDNKLIYYKECEANAFKELALEIKKEKRAYGDGA